MTKILAFFGLDLALVATFIAIGMTTHESAFSAYLQTLAPFALALVVGWVIWLYLGRGTSPARLVAGLVIWGATTGGGLAVRALMGDGVSGAFPLVAAGVLFVFLVGWRGICALGSRAPSDS